MTKDQDSTTQFISKMDNLVSKMEMDAMDAINQRGETIGTTIFKAGIGLPLLISGASNLGSPEHVMGFVAGLALTTWGLRDAGQLPERFRRARDLVTNSRLLRTTLTSNMADDISGIPFRRLEESAPPRLPRGRKSSLGK